MALLSDLNIKSTDLLSVKPRALLKQSFIAAFNKTRDGDEDY